MDAKTISAATAIPKQLKAIMDGLFEESRGALREGVGALRQSLGRLESYLAEVEGEYLTAGHGAKSQASPAAAGRTGRRRRKRTRFATAEFLLGQLTDSPAGLRPVELAERLASATGRDKTSASANVHTTLLRLRQARKVVGRNGVYRPAGSAAAGATGAKGRMGRSLRKAGSAAA